jgi:hypothetical protein
MKSIDFRKFYIHDYGQTDPAETDRVSMRIISLQKNYPDVPYLLKTTDDCKLLPRKNLTALTGLAKKGKSFVSAILEAAAISENGAGVMDITPMEANIKVLHIDTEMDDYTVAARKRSTHILGKLPTDRDSERYTVLALREEKSADRLSIIEEAIRRFKPDIVTIDGIRDLILNFNDLDTSSELIQQLCRISSKYNCAIVCVLHLNPSAGVSAGNTKMRGHLGTELLNRCFDSIEVTKNDVGIISAKQKDNRGKGGLSFSFTVDDEGLPVQCADPIKLKDLKKIGEMCENFKASFGDEKELPYNSLVRNYSRTAKCSEATARRHIKKAQEDGIIKSEDNLYILAYE